MIFPSALDLQILLAVPLFDEADALKQFPRAGVAGHDVGADPVESEPAEFLWGKAVPHNQRQRLGHESFTLKASAAPVTQASVLEWATFDVGQGDPPGDAIA